jgi:hypothetical protein
MTAGGGAGDGTGIAEPTAPGAGASTLAGVDLPERETMKPATPAITRTAAPPSPRSRWRAARSPALPAAAASARGSLESPAAVVVPVGAALGADTSVGET